MVRVGHIKCRQWSRVFPELWSLSPLSLFPFTAPLSLMVYEKHRSQPIVSSVAHLVIPPCPPTIL